MQFISIDKIEPDMISGKTIYHHDGRILLRAGVKLLPVYIEKIRQYGYNGIYIDDEFSKDIVIQEIISEDLRQNTIKNIKRVFIGLEKERIDSVSKTIPDLKNLMATIIEQIIDTKGTVANIIDLKTHDEYTFQHSVNVAVISIVLGLAVDFGRAELFDLGMAALFHDIGKVKIPHSILNKPGRLTEEEFDEMKAHPMYGYEYIKANFDLSATTYVSVLEHHEKYNGEGYPNGLAGEKIVKYARIIAIADVYDAITSVRSYREPMLPSDAFEYIMSNSLIHFDPEFVKVFVKKVAPYPLGSIVKLSNNMRGIVAENYEDCTMRPRIKIITDDLSHDSEDIYIDLKNDPEAMHVTIVGIG